MRLKHPWARPLQDAFNDDEDLTYDPLSTGAIILSKCADTGYDACGPCGRNGLPAA
jgi:hypothetical protein